MSGALPFGNLFCLLQLCFVVRVQLNEGWSDGAKVQGKLPVPGRPTIWITVGQGPTTLAVGAGGVVWTFLHSSILYFLFLPRFGNGPIYIEILSQWAVEPKTTNQPNPVNVCVP